MALVTKTYKGSEAVAAMRENAAGAVVFIEKKAPEGKPWRPGVGYMDTKFKLSPDGKAVNAGFYFRGVLLAKGVSDPTQAAKYQQKDGKKDDQSVSAAFSHNNSGELSEFVALFNATRDEQIKAQEAAGTIVGWSGKQFREMIKDKYSVDYASDEYKGKPFQDPLDKDKTDKRSYLKFDFDTYPNHDSIPEDKRGKPKCIIRDFSTGRLNEETGQIEYALATVDGRPIDHTNAHRFITDKSTIEELYIAVPSTSKSAQGVSTQIVVIEAVVNSRQWESRGMEKQDNADLLAKIMAAQQNKAAPATGTAEEKTGGDATPTPSPAADAPSAAAATDSAAAAIDAL